MWDGRSVWQRPISGEPSKQFTSRVPFPIATSDSTDVMFIIVIIGKTEEPPT
jgi:hypothetical protein